MPRLPILLSSFTQEDNVVNATLNNFFVNGGATFVGPVYSAESTSTINSFQVQAGGITETIFGNLNSTINNITANANARLILSARVNTNIQNITANGYVVNEVPIYYGNVNVDLNSFLSNYKEEQSAPVQIPKCYSYTLKTIQPHINSYGISNTIESNLKFYYDMHMLKLGGWVNVNISNNNIHNIDNSTLRLVDDPNYQLGQVWETPRKEIVWERGIDFKDNRGNIINPIYPGEPIVNGHEAIEWENTSHYIDYENGRVIFNRPFPKNSTVKLSYAYKYVQIYKSHNLPWWQEFQMNSYRFDNTQFNQISSGNWSIFSQHRVQLPAIVIETYPKGTCKNWSLGSDTKDVNREIFFHIYAENKLDRDNIMDIISLETDRQIWLFDINRMNEDKISIFDYKNQIVNNLNYNDLVSVSQYRWKQCFMKNGMGVNINQITPTLYQAVVKKVMNVTL